MGWSASCAPLLPLLTASIIGAARLVAVLFWSAARQQPRREHWSAASSASRTPDGEPVSFFLNVIGALGQVVLSFYAFWLVWRVLLPALPGPPERDDRIAPYAGYFTDPFVLPPARALHLPPRLIALLALALVAIGTVALSRLPGLAG